MHCCWSIFVMELFVFVVIGHVDVFNAEIFAITVKVFIAAGVFIVIVVGLLHLRWLKYYRLFLLLLLKDFTHILTLFLAAVLEIPFFFFPFRLLLGYDSKTFVTKHAFSCFCYHHTLKGWRVTTELFARSSICLWETLF